MHSPSPSPPPPPRPSSLTFLQIIATSPTVGVRALLVVRSLCTALLLAHTILFSCSRHFNYTQFAVWANFSLLLALLFATFSSLLELVSDHTHEPALITSQLPSFFNDNTSVTTTTTSPTTTTTAAAAAAVDTIQESSSIVTTRTPLLHRLLPLLCVPLLQVGGSAVIFATAAHYGTGTTLLRNGAITTRYVDVLLYVANPAIFVLELTLGCRLRQRFRFRLIPLAWLFIGAYYGYAAIANRALLPQGVKNVCIVAGCAAGIPVLLVLLGRLSTCVGNRNREDDDDGDGGIASRKQSSDLEAIQRSSTNQQGENDDRNETNRKRTSTSPKSVSPPPPDRPPSNPLPTNTDRVRKRGSNSSVTSNPDRRFGRITSMRSVSSAASSESRLSHRGRRSSRFVRSLSIGSDSSAWSGINDVAVEMKDEKFRMPGEQNGVKLPPRIANVHSTSLV